MLTVEEIQQAIVSLSSEDRGRLIDWMIECEDAWEDWDRQIAADLRAGKPRLSGPLKQGKKRRRDC